MSRRRLGVFAAVVVAAVGIGAVTATAPDVPTASLRARYADHGSKFVRIGAVEAHVRDEGQGPAILLLHGTSASLHTWDAWSAALRDSFRVVRVDLPGFGLTGVAPDGDYSIPAYTRFVLAAMDSLQLPTAIVIGNSLGGEIAWHVALAAPNRVRKLVLVDPAGLATGRPLPLVFRLARLPVANQLFRYVTPRRIVAKSLHDVYHDGALVSDTLIDRYWMMARAPGARDAFIRRSAMVRTDDGDRLREIRVPTFVLWGDDDRWIPTSLAKEFGARIPGATIALVPNAGHVPMEERPKESLALIRSWIALP